MRGYVQIYTGNGKGKTTAALGQALRAAGAGFDVFIAQFVKGMHYSELNALQRYRDLIKIKQYGRNCFITKRPDEIDIDLAQKGVMECRQILSDPNYRLVILDEIHIAVYFKLVSVDTLLDLIADKPHSTELILTGRYADEKIIEKADLVTEMREVKHYVHKGVRARVGIEK